MSTQSRHRGINFGPRLCTSTMKRFSRTCERRKYEPKPLMKRVLNQVKKSQLAYKLPGKGHLNHDEHKRCYYDKAKSKIGNEREVRQNKVPLQIPGVYPTKSCIRLPFAHLTYKNTDSMAKGASKSNHLLAHTLEDLKQPIISRQSKPLKAKEGFLASSVLKSNSQISPKPMRGLVWGVHKSEIFKKYGVKFGQSTMAKDNIGEELKSSKGKNDSISKELNLPEAKEFLVSNKSNSYEANKRGKICNDEVMVRDDKRILDHVTLGLMKSLKVEHYKDTMKENETLNPSPLTKDEPKKHDRDECGDSKNSRPTKRWRQYIVNADEEDDYDGLNPFDLKDKDSTKDTIQIAPEFVKRQIYNCTQPIDEPIWSGIFKIGGKDYIPFSAHLSTKSCKKVWDFSKSMPSVVQVAKPSRSEVWPKSLESSSPTDDNIGLYFFPPKMRLDKGMDQLVKEVVDKDIALSAIIGEAQMLVFPSTLLPEKYQTFQGKQYLWGVFKSREDKKQAAAMAAEQQHGSDQRGMQEEDNTKQDASMQQNDEVQQLKEPNNNLQETLPVLKHTVRLKEQTPPSPSSATDVHSSVVQEQSTAASARERTDQWRPVEAGRGDAVAALAKNHGRVIGLVVRQTPDVEELIQQMRRGGALVATMEGEMMGSSVH